MMLTDIVYIHGFISSPQSLKAQQLRRYVESVNRDSNLGEEAGVAVHIPALPDHPGPAYDAVNALVHQCVQRDATVGLVGSSLGGFFATVLAERYGLPAVLINPAVRPAELASHFEGEHENLYTGSRFSLSAADVAVLTRLQPQTISPQRYRVMLQEGDETLDYRRAKAFYAGSDLIIEPGGDHSFQGFDRHLPAVLEFLNNSAPIHS